ncbi:E3 ubiquitin-protein ligase RNF180 [Cephus cinctus]|uniref:E3 ubiquitin-protein ligase RNF180 n=1 Tax=Cephus cinctus TaxID=211228 RepID=A0AAJ7BTR6_CEPCN|nr:E3 ubiquitin-protein ligase RNF180 [Cephus cinctus]
MPARVTEVKCKRCRKALFTEEATPLLTAHGEIRTGPMHARCGTGAPEYCLYISLDNMPDWIREAVDKDHWIKGKLHCPYCHSRLGSFDLVNQTKCDCGEFLPPPIRIVHCKVDRLSDTGSNLPFLPLPRAHYDRHRENLVRPIRLIAIDRANNPVELRNTVQNGIAGHRP